MKLKIFGFLFISLAMLGIGFFAQSSQAAEANSSGRNVSYNGSIYFITPDSKKRLYPSKEIFLSYRNNDLATVQPASTTETQLVDGQPMPPREGIVVCSSRTQDLGTCYLITGGKRAPFLNQEVLTGLGYSLETALHEDISYLTLAEPVLSSTEAHRFGTLVNMNGTVYYSGINGLMPFSSPEILLSWGYNFKDVLASNSTDQARPIKFLVETKVSGEPWPFEPILPTPLKLTNEQKFILPIGNPEPVITEAWLYSPAERSIHGSVQHGAVDFADKRGTPIYAAADGYAISSTHLSVLSKMYEGKAVGFGLGEFVQIWHPEQGVYSTYSHLQKVADNIPYFKPHCENDACDPVVVYHNTDYIKKRGVFVKQGDIIGYMGDSGLSWGYNEEPRVERNLAKKHSWDEVHLHFEIFTRNDSTFFKAKRYDPFGIYGRLGQYSESSYSSPDSLWKLDSNGVPVLAQ